MKKTLLVAGLVILGAGVAMATEPGTVDPSVQTLLDGATVTFTAAKAICVGIVAFGVGMFFVRKYSKGRA